MLLKWIICRVPPAQRKAFDTAQRAWCALRDVEGFRGQVGGWDLSEPDDACIVGLWSHPGVYKSFMLDIHDTITGPSGQEATYASCRTGLFETLFEIPGSVKQLTDAFETARILRVAECVVHPQRVAHFVQMQQEVWNPGMATHKAMLGGLFSRSTADPGRFLVTTWWRDRDAHDRYKKTSLPSLRDASDAEKDCRLIHGRLTALDPTWLVPSAG